MNRAALHYFALVFGAGFVLGALRVTLLVPRLGTRWSELLEMPVMFVVVWTAARFIDRRYALPSAAAPRLQVGALALGLMLLAEISLNALIQPQPLLEYWAARDPVSRTAYLLMLVVFALMPWWRGRSL